MNVDILRVTQPRGAQPAGLLVAAVHNASRAALSLAVVAVAVIGTDAAVAVSRTAGSPSGAAAAGLAPSVPASTSSPGVPVSPTSSKPKGAAHTDARSKAARALLRRALANALAKGSVHTVARNVSKKYGPSVFDNYDALTSGAQHFTIYGGNLFVRVIGPTTYYTGDKQGLIEFFGFHADEVAVLHHQWLTIREGQDGYKRTTAGITLKSVLHADRIVGRLHLLSDEIRNGIHVVGVRGTAGGALYGKHATGTMWISAGDAPLPVEFDLKSRDARSVQTFSDWGKPVHITRPANVYGSKTLAS